MESDYGYANARIRAMKSDLLDGHAYASLLAASNIEQIIELLARSAYKADIEATLVKRGGVRCVFEALRVNIARTVGKIKNFFGGRPRQLISILLGRWDMFNLMTILRGQARGVGADEILGALIPAGELGEVDLREMAQQPTIRATADLMVAWGLPYARALSGALRSRSGGDLFHVETRLNQLRYGEALARLGQDENDALVREMLEAEIDVANLTTLLRLCQLDDRTSQLRTRFGAPDAKSLLIESGGLHGRALRELSEADNVEGILRGLGKSVYAATLEQRADLYRESGNIAPLERALEEFVALKGIGMFHRDPLSIAIAIGDIWAKSNEVANVRLIAQGKFLGLDSERIRRELIWWVRE